MTFGYSRDDVGSFLGDYLQLNCCTSIRSSRSMSPASDSSWKWESSEAARSASDLKVGICGEHGGDPESVYFCQQVGLDYVSCSPFRVPIARLAAAQAALKYPR
jgi:pyruvate, orthophosphate dikinase